MLKDVNIFEKLVEERATNFKRQMVHLKRKMPYNFVFEKSTRNKYKTYFSHKRGWGATSGTTKMLNKMERYQTNHSRTFV